MRVRFPSSRIILALLVLTASSLWAQDGLRGAVSKTVNPSPPLWYMPGPQIVAADFDSDQQPDGAVLLDAGLVDGQRLFRIDVHVSAGQNGSLTFASNDRELAISSLDVNRDGAPDLIVEQAFTHERLQVWLNDGHGRFRQARVKDFPRLTDAPWQWHAVPETQLCLVPGLPTKVNTQHAILLLENLRFGSFSSHSKVRLECSHANQPTVASHSPRAPPSTVPA